MTTRERLIEYRRLEKEDRTKAEAFLEEHFSDTRFVSIVQLGERVISEVKQQVQRYEEIVGPIQETEDPSTFFEFLGDAIRNLKR